MSWIRWLIQLNEFQLCTTCSGRSNCHHQLWCPMGNGRFFFFFWLLLNCNWWKCYGTVLATFYFFFYTTGNNYTFVDFVKYLTCEYFPIEPNDIDGLISLVAPQKSAPIRLIRVKFGWIEWITMTVMTAELIRTLN